MENLKIFFFKYFSAWGRLFFLPPCMLDTDPTENKVTWKCYKRLPSVSGGVQLGSYSVHAVLHFYLVEPNWLSIGGGGRMVPLVI